MKDYRELAQRIADALPGDEIVLTGSVSRGMADEVSDIEMLVVTPEPLPLDACFEHARAAGLEQLDTWGPQGGPAQRVFGYCDGVPIETIWWSRELTDRAVDAALAGELSGSADALVHGVALRTRGGLAAWQARLAEYPEELVAARCEEAALPWGGFAPEGLLTIVRPGETLSRLEWMFDGALRVLRIVYAVNRVWQPTTKRLAVRVEGLAVKPERLAERIVEALTEQDARRALLLMTELQLDAVELAPGTPNVVRARAWLARGAEILRRA